MLYYLDDETVQEIVRLRDENTEKLNEVKKRIDNWDGKNMDMLARNDDIRKRREVNAAILHDKLKQAIYDRILPVVIEVVNKYAGKRMGEKTYDKFKAELKARTDCYVYYDSDFDGKYIAFHAVPLSNQGYNDYRFPSFEFAYVAPKGEFAIIDNVLSHVTSEGFSFHGNEVGDHTVDDILTAKENLKNALSALNEAISKYNSIKPSQFKYINNVYISF